MSHFQIKNYQPADEDFASFFKTYLTNLLDCCRCVSFGKCFREKNTIKPYTKKNISYKLNYQNCGAVYIGESGRVEKQRMNEHRLAGENEKKKVTYINTGETRKDTSSIFKKLKS